MRQFFYILCLWTFVSMPTWAQGSEVEMADALRANGKIYVVVAVLATIFLGIVLYLLTLDRKVKKLIKD
ncbi:hypothetical protein FHS56_001541 [Thermonema lapsum]|uniref:CcmD family protein n=1 Tax=Thermonema lapsum TaxID=28195 RepID=A0A846MQU6_9BACT|nr:CcmD family protein [Thermonema lapsum]NIK74028.1 hypothetical protein [Thermonema lapsum]